MAKAFITQELKAPLAKVWPIIRDFNHVDHWVEDVKVQSITGSGIGTIRHLITNDGLKVDEKLLKLDDEQHIISYGSVETELPFENYVAIIAIKKLTPDTCEVTWTSTFEPVKLSEQEAVSILEKNYPRYLTKVEELSQS